MAMNATTTNHFDQEQAENNRKRRTIYGTQHKTFELADAKEQLRKLGTHFNLSRLQYCILEYIIDKMWRDTVTKIDGKPTMVVDLTESRWNTKDSLAKIFNVTTNAVKLAEKELKKLDLFVTNGRPGKGERFFAIGPTGLRFLTGVDLTPIKVSRSKGVEPTPTKGVEPTPTKGVGPTPHNNKRKNKNLMLNRAASPSPEEHTNIIKFKEVKMGISKHPFYSEMIQAKKKREEQEKQKALEEAEVAKSVKHDLGPKSDDLWKKYEHYFKRTYFEFDLIKNLFSKAQASGLTQQLIDYLEFYHGPGKPKAQDTATKMGLSREEYCDHILRESEASRKRALKDEDDKRRQIEESKKKTEKTPEQIAAREASRERLRIWGREVLGKNV